MHCRYSLLNTGDGVQGIRLVDGLSNSSGRVEVFSRGQWGTVCGYNWDRADASVVCRQLGYKAATAAPTWAFFGEGSGPIWMKGVQCNGNELSISSCSEDLPLFVKCHHRMDAAVICGGKDKEDFFLISYIRRY